MNDFDKKIKRMSADFKIPEEYGQRIEDLLQTMPDKTISASTGRRKLVGRLVMCICMLGIGFFLLFRTEVVEAGFFENFRQTIMTFLGIGDDGEAELTGVESAKENAVSKPDLMLELQEKVIDSKNIYLMVKITAPTNIVFADNITFDYFAFSRGTSFNTAELLPGAKGCELLEVMGGREHIATYVVSFAPDEELEEGTEVTAFFKDLMIDPYGDSPEMLVEGMWSIPFTIEYTVSEELEAEGAQETTYTFLDSTAVLKEIDLTPLGLTLVSDISDVPYDLLGISDTTVDIRLLMADGSEKTVMSHDMEEATITSSGSNSFETEEDGCVYMRNTFQFQQALDISQVVSVWVEGCEVPFES